MYCSLPGVELSSEICLHTLLLPVMYLGLVVSSLDLLIYLKVSRLSCEHPLSLPFELYLCEDLTLFQLINAIVAIKSTAFEPPLSKTHGPSYYY